MGQIVHAFIEHRLTTGEILKLPEQLRHISNDALAGQWRWTAPNMDKELLTELWTRKAEYFIKYSWGEADLALLKNNNLTLHFFTSYLLTFDNLLSWDTYRSNSQLFADFNILAKSIAILVNAIDVLIVPGLSSYGLFNENEDMTVDVYRQKANGNEMYAIELK